jgi:hypothetical protein
VVDEVFKSPVSFDESDTVLDDTDPREELDREPSDPLEVDLSTGPEI